MKLFSPAKLNLFFRVLRKRGDGFHEVGSLCTLIDLFDVIDINHADQDIFFCDRPDIPSDHTNLAIRARDLFREYTNIQNPISIDLKKSIPAGAGLAGGSGNAATVLWGLNQLFDEPLTINELQELGAKIGSDVSLFFSTGLVYTRGRGELLEEVAFTYENKFSLAIPIGLFSSTPMVYKHCFPDAMTSLSPRELLKEFNKGRSIFVNDLEPIACKLYPKLFSVKKQLELYFTNLCMTGSGSAFFAESVKEVPEVTGISFHSVRCITRKESSWYKTQKHLVAM